MKICTLCALAGSLAMTSALAQAPRRVERADDLPRFSYPVQGDLEAVVRDPQRFAVLAQPRAPLTLNWEIRDMLLMTGRHIASHLALLETNEALIEARQFEAFNRLSAYVVHDLKNLLAQLSLLVSNAARHRDNPARERGLVANVHRASKGPSVRRSD